MKIIIDLPDDLAPDIIKNAALLRKTKNIQAARQGHESKGIDKNLPDDQYLIADIRAAIIADHVQVVRTMAQQKAGRDAEDAEFAKLNGPKKSVK